MSVVNKSGISKPKERNLKKIIHKKGHWHFKNSNCSFLILHFEIFEYLLLYLKDLCQLKKCNEYLGYTDKLEAEPVLIGSWKRCNVIWCQIKVLEFHWLTFCPTLRLMVFDSINQPETHIFFSSKLAKYFTLIYILVFHCLIYIDHSPRFLRIHPLVWVIAEWI